MSGANLPDAVLHARLPDTYTKAKIALSACERIDECKNWADKAEALASYARQSGDVELRRMADRIQARAFQQCGILIKQIPSEQGQRNDKQLNAGGPIKLSARDIARIAAGVSKHLMRTAVEVSNIPKAKFEQAVESANPPSVTKLAEMGRQRRAPPKAETRAATPEETRAARKLVDALDAFVAATKDLKIELALGGCTQQAAALLKKDGDQAQAFLAMLSIKIKGRRTWAEA